MSDEPVYYHDYLDLDRLLGAQHPRSGPNGAQDEMLFIIVHQAYELWFKQILHELDAVLETFGRRPIKEREMGSLVAHLERIVAIQRVMLEQLEVLETMTPLDFLDFRNLLGTASGFQSVQFRLVENKMGLLRSQRAPTGEAPYTAWLSAEHRRMVENAERGPSLVDLVEGWLERTPFLEMGEYHFWEAYKAAVNRMLATERARIEADPTTDEKERDRRLARVDANRDTFDTIFDDERYEALRRQGSRRLSRRALEAALLITLYRDEPILQLPFRLLTGLIDIDEGFTAWRQRHVLMVTRMIGHRTGTGGTAGAEYLDATTRHARVFTDLIDIPTFLIPRSELPALPDEVVEAMRFRLGAQEAGSAL
jgi:tryptophan 2,3-dioxygenase